MPTTAFQNNSALLFVPNQGQTDERARFIARVNGQQFYFLENGIAAVTYAREKGETANPRDTRHDPMQKRTPVSDVPMRGKALFLTFEGAAKAEPQGQKQAAGRFHYFTGNDPANWRTGLPSYEQLLYANLYDGVDLKLAGGEGGLKFLWTLKEARNVGAIRIRYEGAEEIRISEDGSLVIRHALGELIDPTPIAWQERNGENSPVACAYALEGDTVSFTLSGAYDANAPLYIDPILPYSTYLGGSAYDAGYAITVDAEGCAYIGGFTISPDFPTTPDAFQPTFPGAGIVFLTKFAPDGKTLEYSTYIGGSTNNAACMSIAVDKELCTYLTGYTSSWDYPVTPGAFQTVFAGGIYDAFITKLSADGASLLYSTYLGGSARDIALSIAIDSQGFAYVSGSTDSDDFPVTPGAFQTTWYGPVDAFVSKLSQNGASLVYSTLFGAAASPGGIEANAIAVDGQGYAYITGDVNSSKLPVTSGVFQPLPGGGYDSFITKFSADGARLVYSSYLGGSNMDIGYAIVVDEAGCAVIAGITGSPDFPVTPGAFQTAYAGGLDVFITKVSPSGRRLYASTYLGGDLDDLAYGAALDSQSNVYITGYTNSTNFPITPMVVSSFLHGEYDAFVSILSSDLRLLLVSYYLGGGLTNEGQGVALGNDGAVFTAGHTDSPDFPVTPGTFQTTFGGIEDAFVTKEGFALLKKASVSIQETH